MRVRRELVCVGSQKTTCDQTSGAPPRSLDGIHISFSIRRAPEKSIPARTGGNQAVARAGVMVFSMSFLAARTSGGGSVAPRSCSKMRPAKTKHIFANVLATVLCLVLSRVPVASAGIFPYDNMELQVSGIRVGGLGDLRCDGLDSSMLSYAPLFCFRSHIRKVCGGGIMESSSAFRSSCGVSSPLLVQQ